MKRAISSSPAPPGTSSGLTESIATSSATSSRSVTAPPRRDRTLRVCGVRVPCRAGTLSAPNLRPTVRRSTREHRSRGSRCRIEGQGRSRAHRRAGATATAFSARVLRPSTSSPRPSSAAWASRSCSPCSIRRTTSTGASRASTPRRATSASRPCPSASSSSPASPPSPGLPASSGCRRGRAGSTATGPRSSGWSSARAASATSSRPDSSSSGSSARTPTSPSLRTAGPSTARTRCST